MRSMTTWITASILVVSMSFSARADAPTGRGDLDALGLALPHPGSGRLASVRRSGPNRPESPALLVVATAEKSRSAAIALPWEARWAGASELVVSHRAPELRDGFGTTLSRVDFASLGAVTFSDRRGLSAPRPAPDGSRIALTRLSLPSGKQHLEIHPLGAHDAGSGQPLVFEEIAPIDLVWSPDGDHIVASVGVVEADGRIWPRLRRLDVQSGAVAAVDDGGQAQGVTPLFWTRRGLFVHDGVSVRRCDLEGSGCSVVFTPEGERRLIRRGTAVGGDRAYVLVSDGTRDAFETRSHELHELDLESGSGKRLLRLPDGLFLEDIDWVDDPPS